MKHIVYVLTLAFAMMASTALAQTESHFCDLVSINGKNYPATNIAQKGDMTILSVEDHVIASIATQHPQNQEAIALSGKIIYNVAGKLTTDLVDMAVNAKQLNLYGSVNNSDIEKFGRNSNTLIGFTNGILSANFVGVNGEDVTSLRDFLANSEQATTVAFENCNFANVEDLSYVFERMVALKSISFTGMGLTNKVNDLTRLLRACDNLQSIDFSGCDFSNVTKYNWMFWQCPKLTEIKAVGCNEATIELLRKAIENNGQTNQVTLITE